MGPLARNLDAIRRSSSALAERIESAREGDGIRTPTSRSGACAFGVGERLETSLEDPEAEGLALARRLRAQAEKVGAERLVLLGLPVYGLRELAGYDGRVLIVEPSLELVRAVLARVDHADALARVELVVSDRAEEIAAHPVFAGSGRGILLATPPAARRAPALHDQLLLALAPGGERAPLDIAVLPPLHGGSLPVAAACARAFRALGHRVREIDLEPFLPAHQAVDSLLPDLRLSETRRAVRAGLSRLLGEALLAAFRLDPPDLVFVLAQAPVDAALLRDLRRQGIPVGYWFCEDFRVMSYWRELAPHCDAFFHLQPADFSEPLRAAGGRGVPLPMAFDPAVHRPLQPAPGPDIPLSFIGAAYHNRVRFLPGLFDLGLRVYGVGWPASSGWLAALDEPGLRQSSEASNRIFNRSCINLNLHSSPWTDGVNPAGDYLNPRSFELAGARAFQLVDERSELAASFEPGVEITTFRDLAECRSAIRRFSDAPEARREQAERAHARALRQHTYRQRMELALDVLRAGAALAGPRKRAVSTVASAIEDASAEPGLREILARLDPERPLDAPALSLAVERGKGPLSDDEKLLLFMREAAHEVELRPAPGHRAGGAA